MRYSGLPATMAMVFAAFCGAQAAVTRVTSRAMLAGDLAISWQNFGEDGKFLSTPVSRRFKGQRVGLASSSGGLLPRREGTSWVGDFRRGQYLMTQPYQSDSFLISFDPPVAGMGVQIDPGGEQGRTPPYTGYFVAILCLYGADGAFLGRVERASKADADETGSAKFLGARSSVPIGYVSLRVSGVTPGFTVEGDLAVNRMELVTGGTRVEGGVAAAAPGVCR